MDGDASRDQLTLGLELECDARVGSSYAAGKLAVLRQDYSGYLSSVHAEQPVFQNEQVIGALDTTFFGTLLELKTPAAYTASESRFWQSF